MELYSTQKPKHGRHMGESYPDSEMGFRANLPKVSHFTDESLSTFFCKVETIVLWLNSAIILMIWLHCLQTVCLPWSIVLIYQVQLPWLLLIASIGHMFKAWLTNFDLSGLESISTHLMQDQNGQCGLVILKLESLSWYKNQIFQEVYGLWV